MKLQVRQAGAAGELTVSSQKEFLQLFQRGVIAREDLVLRAEKWVPVGDLPWVQGMAVERKRDNKRLFWITLFLMLAGLAGVVWIESHAGVLAKKVTGEPPPPPIRPQPQRETPLPPGAVHAIPR